jgi:hypothetical protein
MGPDPNDRFVPIAEAWTARFSVRYGENRRQKETHLGAAG